MDNKQKRFLDKRLREHAKIQPEILKLKKLLLNIGGCHLVAPHLVHDSDIPFLIECGFLMQYPVVEKIMERGECHLNASILFAAGRVNAIGTGYAIFSNGLWASHSWGVRREKNGTNVVVETTFRSEYYFGLLMWGPWCELFASNQYDLAGMKPPAKAFPFLKHCGEDDEKVAQK
jgi:hypothetical protein